MNIASSLAMFIVLSVVLIPLIDTVQWLFGGEAQWASIIIGLILAALGASWILRIADSF